MLDRRTLLKAFISSALTSALLPVIPMSAIAAEGIPMGANVIRKPKRLRAGQTLSLIHI